MSGIFEMAKPLLIKSMKKEGIKSYLLTIDDLDNVKTFPYSTNVKEFIDNANERIISLNSALENCKKVIQDGHSENFDLQAENIKLKERIKELENNK